MPQTSPLTDLLQSFNLLLDPTSGQLSNALDALLEQWEAFFMPKGASAAPTAAEIAAWQAKVQAILQTPDRQAELELIKAGNDDPRLGLALVAATIPGVAKRQAIGWWNTLFIEQTATGEVPGWRTISLPSPGKIGTDPTVKTDETKYLIFSDVHRDASTDNVGVLEVGSIDHFSKNEALYLRLLQYADTNHYTVIEAGDCEELWFVRSTADYPKKADGSMDVEAKLLEIIDSHPDIYAQLIKLHLDHRYFRIQGNHDSFLKPDGADDSLGELMRLRMQGQSAADIAAGVPPPVPFVIYDGIVIPDVKTMMEGTAFDLLKNVATLVAGQASGNATGALHDFMQSVLKGRLGLDASAYTDKRNMLICHGHQFDPWNCPDNEILGMLIANSVGVFVDRLMDPFVDARGIAWQGNPVVDFGDMAAGWPVFNSWPDRQAAVRFAHKMQHMENSDRVLNDNIMFYESLVALYGGIGMALNGRDDAGTMLTPAQSRAQLNLLNPLDLATYLSRHHFHHICIGHTHAPHSQPFFTLNNIGSLILPLWPVTKALTTLLPDSLQPALKTSYFNTGTVGWMEGVAWAVEIDISGQARLVFWTENSIGPEYMDWELSQMPAATSSKLLSAVGTFLETPFADDEQSIDQVYAQLKAKFGELGVAGRAAKGALTSGIALPIHVIAAALMTPASTYADDKKANRTWTLKEVKAPAQQLQKLIDGGVDALKHELEQLRNFGMDVLMSVKRRALTGFPDTSATETFNIIAPIASSARDRLLQLADMFSGMNNKEGEARHFAGLAFAIFEEFPRNMPFFTTMSEPQHPQARLFSADAPILQALLGTLWMYPPAGQVVEINGVRISSVFSVQEKTVSLQVAISAASLANV